METLLHLSHELQSCPSHGHTVTLLGLLAGSRGPIPAPSAIAEAERQVSVVDTLETRVQETQKVVAELGKKLEKNVRDLKKQWDSKVTELEDDLELRVDEIAKSVRDGSEELPGTCRQEPGALGCEIAYRFLRPLDDRVTHLIGPDSACGGPAVAFFAGVESLSWSRGRFPWSSSQLQYFSWWSMPLLCRSCSMPCVCIWPVLGVFDHGLLDVSGYRNRQVLAFLRAAARRF